MAVGPKLPPPIQHPAPKLTTPTSEKAPYDDVDNVALDVRIPEGAPPGWKPADGIGGAQNPIATQAPEPGLLQKGKDKVLQLGFEEAGKEHGLNKSVGFGHVSGNIKLTEQVAIRGTKSYDKLVAPDRRRREYAEANLDSTWVRTSAMIGASGSVPLGTRVTFGLAGSVEVSSILVHHKPTGVKDAAGDVKLQLKSMAVPVTADGLRSLNPALGSEFLFRGMLNENASAYAGRSTTVGGPHVTLSESHGLGGSITNTDVYTKSVKVLEDNKVYVRIGKVDEYGASIVGSAQIRLEVAQPDEKLAPKLLGEQEGRAGEVADKVEAGVIKKAIHEIEKRTQIDLNRGRSRTYTDQELGAVVLDLSTTAGSEAYDYLVKASPTDGVKFLKDSNQGVQVETEALRRNRDRGIRIGRFQVIKVSSEKSRAHGTVEQAGHKTDLQQAGYVKSVEGIIPRVLFDEERRVEVRAGEFTRDDEPPQRAVAITLRVSDPKLTATEANQIRRFAKGMEAGVELPSMPPAAEPLGNGVMRSEIALTHSGILKLREWNRDDKLLGFALAHMEIDGQTSPGPMVEYPDTFAHYFTKWYLPMPGELEDAPRHALREVYQERFPGRDLDHDIDAYETATKMIDLMEKYRDKPVEEWGPMLEALADCSSRDIRAVMLALKKLAGAELTELKVTAKGFNAEAKMLAPAPLTINQYVESLLAPPE